MRLSFFLLLSLWLVSCSEEDADSGYEAIVENDTLSIEIPDYFPEVTYNFEANPPTEKGFELGKKLFYDGKLSSDGVVSCGFCHIQDFSFTHHTHIVSHGVNGALGTRNAQPLQNMIFMNEFTWDGAAESLDAQPIIPITAEVEMNESFSNIIDKLQADEEYPQLFAEAFENGEVNTDNMLKAISQFLVMMVSADSKYDKILKNEGSQFTDEEEAGKVLFDQKCATCHAGVLFTDQSYRNNGLPIDPEYDDEGRSRVTGLQADKYKFKVPSLRNIQITYPYMHDGRFQTLAQVLDHYDSGMVVTENLDPVFQQNENLGISLTEDEKQKIIAFLETLTDDNFLLDDRFAEF
ncbi:cytochrome-c peroxidase [Mesonia mobilis]|uniref:cytochrome-c peroxidase n=1 Tax=Mesonia mobilis TaxID=369791 RepID=UPI0024BBD0EA|nr:cytochrome c peroxidase [Mesonia mobilis]